jgi:hypothetical protein
MENQLFYVVTKKSLVRKGVGLGKMHMFAKNEVNIQNFAMEVSKTMVTWVESQVKSCLVAFFMKSFSMKPWNAMFGIFPRYHITYVDSMRWFAIFSIFLTTFGRISNLGQTRGARRLC